MSHLIDAASIKESHQLSKAIIPATPCHRSTYYSQKYQAQVYFKREDLHVVRSFKIRGAATAFRKLTAEERARGVVTASAGNHAQGIAFCCHKFAVKGTIFMPSNAPQLKVDAVKYYGGRFLEVKLVGNTFDDAVKAAQEFQVQHNCLFVHAFNDRNVVEGQGGIAVEILEHWPKDKQIDYVFVCVGGGGLASGIGSYFAQAHPTTRIVGFEPLGSPSMFRSLQEGRPLTLESIDTFVDGASMRKTGQVPFVVGMMQDILRELQTPIHLVEEGRVAATITDLLNFENIVCEPAGALGVAGLELLAEEVKGKTVVCILSGSNNDISRQWEIRLRGEIFRGQKAFFLVRSSSFSEDFDAVDAKQLVSGVIDSEKESITALHTSLQSHGSRQCVLGLKFEEAGSKEDFRRRAEKSGYTLTEIGADNPMLRSLI